MAAVEAPPTTALLLVFLKRRVLLADVTLYCSSFFGVAGLELDINCCKQFLFLLLAAKFTASTLFRFLAYLAAASNVVI